VSLLHLLELLGLAALYFRALGLADGPGEKLAGRMHDCALAFGFLFKVWLAGWQLFCAQEELDPEICWAPLPGYSTVKEAERVAAVAAFSPEGVVAYGKRAARGNVSPPTAGLQATLEERAEWWG
jgi:hypothetical protein